MRLVQLETSLIETQTRFEEQYKMLRADFASLRKAQGQAASERRFLQTCRNTKIDDSVPTLPSTSSLSGGLVPLRSDVFDGDASEASIASNNNSNSAVPGLAPAELAQIWGRFAALEAVCQDLRDSLTETASAPAAMEQVLRAEIASAPAAMEQMLRAEMNHMLETASSKLGRQALAQSAELTTVRNSIGATSSCVKAMVQEESTQRASDIMGLSKRLDAIEQATARISGLEELCKDSQVAA
eukprot:CAMPEP_0172832442 /NCGR_PEP_ID=MMETSP1075-20121228/23663_1 /TAXON_ID=2916 /ORGANISM="Ceratium fusus, Strain PA161109" /LENGTH=241 /DNA_ID=CAMNT_0013675045 /DNA_START=31 /DNA_END=753 /DNA_ORIENTATION=+